MIEVIRWISLVMLWVAVAINIYSIWRNVRLHKELKKQLHIWGVRNKYFEENENETDAL